jgi:hypothetical protein
MTALEQLKRIFTHLDLLYMDMREGTEPHKHMGNALSAIETAIEALGEVVAAEQDEPD